MLNIIDGNYETKKCFSDLDIGEIFKYNSEFYIKCTKGSINFDSAYGFTTKQMENFYAGEAVIPYEADLIIKHPV